MTTQSMGNSDGSAGVCGRHSPGCVSPAVGTEPKSCTVGGRPPAAEAVLQACGTNTGRWCGATVQTVQVAGDWQCWAHVSWQCAGCTLGRGRQLIARRRVIRPGQVGAAAVAHGLGALSEISAATVLGAQLGWGRPIDCSGDRLFRPRHVAGCGSRAWICALLETAPGSVRGAHWAGLSLPGQPADYSGDR